MPDNKTVTFDASQYQLVPKVPTDEMLDAASHASMQHLLDCIKDPVKARELGSEENVRKTHASRYQSMLAAAPAPAAQSAGQEAIYQARTGVSEWADLSRLQFERIKLDKRIVYAAPVNGGERELGQVIDERDQYHDAAEKLADAIAKHFGVEIGEHSNLNCPWQNALDHIALATKRAADAQQADEHDMRLRLLLCTENTGGLGYFDDGEMQDNSAVPAIDFKRQPWSEIAAALVQRNKNAALTSPAKVPDPVMQALDRMSTPLHDSRLSGLTAELDAANIKTIRDYVLSGAMPAKVVGDDQHPDDAAVDRFSVAMKAKLAKKRAQGRGGWDDERICSPDDLARMLVDHVRKGDPVDVGNFAMILFNRPDSGAALCRAALSTDGGEDKRDAERWRAFRNRNELPDYLKAGKFFGAFGDEADAIIDAAIAANQSGKGDE